MQNQKVLVVRFSSIGDIVLTSPVVRCLKKQLNAEVHYLTFKKYAFLVDKNPYIDKLQLVDKEPEELKTELLAENYDAVVDLHHNLRTLKLKRMLGVKQFYPFPKENINKWLYVNFKWDKLPNVHVVDRYFEAVKNLGVVNDQKGLDYFGEEEIEVPEKPYLALVIGGQFATKQMPATLLQEIIDATHYESVVLLGGKEDRYLVEQLNDSLKVVDLVGNVSFHASAYVVKMADLVVTNDTGLMHVATAFYKTIRAVWGNTTPRLGMYPYLPENPDLFKNVELFPKCRPCSKIGFASCPKKHFSCMQHTAASVLD